MLDGDLSNNKIHQLSCISTVKLKIKKMKILILLPHCLPKWIKKYDGINEAFKTMNNDPKL